MHKTRLYSKIGNSLLTGFFILSCQTGQADREVDSQLGRVVYRCKSASPTRHVWVFKQDGASDSIQLQISEWLKERQITTIVVSECEDGEPGKWTDHRANVSVLCGDDTKLANETDEAFEESEKITELLTQIDLGNQSKKSKKTQISAACKKYKLPLDTSVSVLRKRLLHELRFSIARVYDLIDRRNKKALKKVKELQDSNIALIFQGANVPGIVKGLESANIGCTVIEPMHYRDEHSKLLQKLILLVRQKFK